MNARYLNYDNEQDFDELKLGIAVTLVKAVAALSSSYSCSVLEACIKLDVTEGEYKAAKKLLKDYGPEILTFSEQKEVESLLIDGLSVDEVIEETGFLRESVEGIYNIIFIPKVFDVVYSPELNLSGIVCNVTREYYEVLWRDKSVTSVKIGDGRKLIIDEVRSVLDRNIENI